MKAHKSEKNNSSSAAKKPPSEAICIIGAGSIGIVMTTILSRLTVPYLLTRKVSVQALQSSHLNVTGDLNESLSPAEFHAISSDELSSLPANTAYFLCVKSHQLAETLQELAPFVTEETQLFLLSNGLSVFIEASDILLPKRPQLYRLLCYFGSSASDELGASASGESGTRGVRVSGNPVASLTALKEQKDSLRHWMAAIQSSGLLELFTEKDVATAEWNKLPTNLIVNSLATLVERENGVILSSPHLQRIARRIFDELACIAHEEGFTYPNDKFDAVLAGIESHAMNINSTLTDFRAGKKSEMEALVGRVLQIAKLYKLDAPCIATLYDLLKATETLKH